MFYIKNTDYEKLSTKLNFKNSKYACCLVFTIYTIYYSIPKSRNLPDFRLIKRCIFSGEKLTS